MAPPVDSKVGRRCTPWAVAPFGLMTGRPQKAAAPAAIGAKGCFRTSTSTCSVTTVRRAALDAATLDLIALKASEPLALNGLRLPFPCFLASRMEGFRNLEVCEAFASKGNVADAEVGACTRS
eukprot:4617194-Alexandrium_andersonii.AAC.1